ncbi:MAG: AMP-dependent synthetase [Rhodospirillaceae bacterium BRH_c57]|nr:MAG: AMP-dependent synthetase [Rhodospirillaceae bacterium BRH_c57]
MNVAALLDRTARVHGARPAVAHGGHDVLTYAQLARRAGALAAGLRTRLGLAVGDRVAIFAHNVPAYVETLFAVWQAGLVAVPVNAKLHPRELAWILEHSDARAVFATPDLAGLITGPVPVLDMAGADTAGMAEGVPMGVEPRAPDDLAWLFYTSGTTGRPKGAMLSHRNLMSMTACYFMDVDSIAPDDSLLHAAPMSHGSGFYILPHVAAAAKQVVPDSGGFDPAEVCSLLAAHHGVSMFAAPTMVHRLIESPEVQAADLTGLKTIIYGGGPMYAEDCVTALDLLGPRLAQIYGQGESPMTITALSKAHHADITHPRHAARLASVGVRQAMVEVRVGGPDDSELPPDAVGEVLVRGEAVMLGYWKNPDATVEALRNGWLHTGDMGAMDADGFLTLKDRSKDVIITGGSNVYPREVEEVLLTHPAVAEASVIGVPHADWGEEVVAVVVASGAVDAAALDALCLDAIARFKRPKRYVFVAELPKNNYGKVLKTALRDMV